MIAERLEAIGRVIRRIIGAPDYEQYLQLHRAEDGPALTRDDFAREALRRRYEKPGSRCC